MRQIPMLTTVGQNQRTFGVGIFRPLHRLVRATVVHMGISRSFFLQCNRVCRKLGRCKILNRDCYLVAIEPPLLPISALIFF
jgi:hypothetical protein